MLPKMTTCPLCGEPVTDAYACPDHGPIRHFTEATSGDNCLCCGAPEGPCDCVTALRFVGLKCVTHRRIIFDIDDHGVITVVG